MRINRQEMIGKVVEKKRAWKIDKSYKAKQVAPGLLEQVDYTQLELRINPLSSTAEQRVKATYFQEFDFDHDPTIYVYPLATTVSSSGSWFPAKRGPIPIAVQN